MQKTKLRERIRDAWHAFKHSPTLVKFEQRVVHVSRPRVETYSFIVDHPDFIVDLSDPEGRRRDAERDLARRIGKTLMAAGAIEVRHLGELIPGHDAYRGVVRVVMPEKADGLKEEPEEC